MCSDGDNAACVLSCLVARTTEQLDLAPLYTLRAEDLTSEELRQWTGFVPQDESILRRLTGPGPKLLKGPRGSGKSNYLKRAYYKLKETDNVVVAYVNYSQHLALEPLMLRSEKALEHFRQWLIYKVVVGLHQSLGHESPKELEVLAGLGQRYIDRLQTSIGEAPEDNPPLLSPTELLAKIESWTSELGRTRAVLLMDDAAHAFMQQQQREFFEVFRALRSRGVACKAAIYPGVTSYSAFFNIGHEADEIEVWIRPDSPDYLEAMRSIFRARFPAQLQAKVRPELIDMAAHAAFGLPRNFLNILADSLGEEAAESDSQASGGGQVEVTISAPTLSKIRAAVSENAQRVRSLFDEIASKLPRYENFVRVGTDIQALFVQEIRETNRNRGLRDPKYIGMAIGEPWDPDLTQVFSLLEYAGVVRRIGAVSRGRDRYQKVQVHTSLLIADNALSLGRSPSAEDFSRALARQSADDFVRRQAGRVMTVERAQKCRLNLSPCPRCLSPRVSDDAVFCVRCGNPLTEQSVYIDLLSTPIERLNLTAVKLARIHELTPIRTVQDVLLDDNGAQLRTVPSIGRIWAARIKTRAEEFVAL